MVAAMDKEIALFDVKATLLNGSLDKEIYMEQPEGYEDGSDRVCRLHRSTYGLKQSPCCWHGTIDKFFTDFGFVASEKDPCMYVSRSGTTVTDLICLYVNDGLLYSSIRSSGTDFIAKLKATFCTTVGESDCYVGTQLERDRKAKTIKITQYLYIRWLLHRFGLQDAKTVTTPMDPSFKLTERQEEEVYKCPYLEAIRYLIYTSVNSKLDISLAMNALARFSNSPTG